jgi:hypothetical protein
VTRAQLSITRAAVAQCGGAIARLTPLLQAKARDHAAKAATEAHFLCSASLARITAANGSHSALDPCRQSLILLERFTSREVAALDAPAPDTQAAAISAFDGAIGQQRACDIALDRVAGPANPAASPR